MQSSSRTQVMSNGATRRHVIGSDVGDTPRSEDDSQGSSIDDETEESLIAKRVERLASSLQDTGKNLRNVSGMLEDFKEKDQGRGAAIDHLRMELQHSTELLREERRRSLRERDRMQYNGVRGRSASPGSLRRVQLGANSGGQYASFSGSATRSRTIDMGPRQSVRSNRSVSPSMGRRSTYRHYSGVYNEPVASGYPLYVSGAEDHSYGLALESDRSAGEAETKQLLQELVENQRTLMQVQSAPTAGMSKQYQNEVDRIAHLEQMLNQLQNDVRQSKESKIVQSRHYDNPDISEELRKELMSQHPATPQIRTPRSPHVAKQQQLNLNLPHSMEDEKSQVANEQNERNLKRKLIRSESAIVELEKQLDEAHRRLENAEFSRNDVQRQITEMKEQLNKSEQDRDVLRNRVNDYTQDIQREVAKREEAFASEKRTLEEEVRKLRSQLNDPRRTAEIDNLKADYEKLEKQKSNFSNKVEELQKKNQEKDLEITDYTYKNKDLSNRLEDSDRVKKKAISRVDDLTRELNVLKIDREKMVEQIRTNEAQINQKQKENDELTSKSKTLITALKSKVQKLTTEVENMKDAERANSERMYSLQRDVEAARLAATADSMQLAAIHKEIHDVMVMRSEQEDLMRRKNEEIHDLRGELDSLQRAHTAAKDDMDKMEEEITLNRKRLMEAESKKEEQEDELVKLRADFDVTKDEMNRATAKADELTSQVEHLEKRLSDEVGDKEEAKAMLLQTEKKERLAREEISSLLIKMNDQEQMHFKIVDELKRDIQELVDVEQKNVQEMVATMKSERNKLENEIANLRSEVSHEKELSFGLREDVERLEKDLCDMRDVSKKQSENELALNNKIEALQFEITIKDNLAQELESRIKKLERTLKGAKEKIRKEEQDMLTVMTAITKSINSLVDIAAGEVGGSLSRHKSVPSNTDPIAWLAEIKAKLSWLLTEVSSWYSKEKDVQSQLRRTQQDIMTLLNSSNHDKSFFMDQLEKQNSAIKNIASDREDVKFTTVDQESRLLTLHHNVEDLSNRLQMSSQLLEARLNMMNLKDGNINSNNVVSAKTKTEASSSFPEKSRSLATSSRHGQNSRSAVSEIFFGSVPTSSSSQQHSSSISQSSSSVLSSQEKDKPKVSFKVSEDDYKLSSQPGDVMKSSNFQGQHALSSDLKSSSLDNSVAALLTLSSSSYATLNPEPTVSFATIATQKVPKLPSSKTDSCFALKTLKDFKTDLKEGYVNSNLDETSDTSFMCNNSSLLSTNKTCEHVSPDKTSDFDKEAEKEGADNYKYSASNLYRSKYLSQPSNRITFTPSVGVPTVSSVSSSARTDGSGGYFNQGTDSTVTPEQSVIHYAPPLSMDFSSLPFQSLEIAAGNGQVYPQSTSTPAPDHHYRMTSHTPPTRHGQPHGHRMESTNGVTYMHNQFASRLNTKDPMSMTDEEFSSNFVPHTPPSQPSNHVASILTLQK